MCSTGPLPANEVAFVHPCYELAVVVQMVVVECGPVASAIVDVDALAACALVYRAQDVQDLFVLAHVPRCV